MQRETVFFWQLETPEYCTRARMDKIGLNALIGFFDNWRTNSYFIYVIFYWKSCFRLSFPRVRIHVTEGIAPTTTMMN